MRGCQRKVIYLKNTGSHLFDEAYFVVSREGEFSGVGQSDMVVEANRIIDESLKDESGKRKDRRLAWTRGVLIPFLIGILTSTAVFMTLKIFFGI